VEVVGRRPVTIIDAAHNARSIEALVETLYECFPPARRRLLFATGGDKDTRGMLEQLKPHFDTMIFTRYYNNPRAAAPESLLASMQHITGPTAPTGDTL
jgi:dihydrofolate synthase / folylpolyglutamate synthase